MLLGNGKVCAVALAFEGLILVGLVEELAFPELSVESSERESSGVDSYFARSSEIWVSSSITRAGLAFLLIQ